MTTQRYDRDAAVGASTLCRSLLLTALLTASAQSGAALVTGSYVTAVYFRDCDLTTCGSFSQAPTAGFIDVSLSGRAETLDPQAGNATLEELGSGSGVATVGGTLLSPLLQTEIQTTTASFVSSQAMVLQRYVNLGSSSIDVALNALVEWDVSNFASPIGSVPHGLVFQTVVFENDNGLIDINLASAFTALTSMTNYFSDPATLVDDLYYNSTVVSDAQGTGNVATFGSPLVTLGPGQGLFAGGRLVAIGGFGMGVDAFNTMETFFVDENGVPLDRTSSLRPVGVPEPDTLAMLVPGLLGLLALRRRRIH